MRIAVIGSTGFIGSAISKILQTDKQNIVVGFSRKNIDIQNIYNTKSVLNDCEKFDILIYSAISKGNDFVNKNLQQLENVLKCKDCFQKLVHISSRSVYDGLGYYSDVDCLPLSELPLSNNIYGKLKYLEEKIITDYLSEDEFLICRLFNIYNLLDNNAFYNYLQRIINKNEVFHEIVLNMMSLNDCAQNVKTIINKGLCGTLNLCSAHKVSFKDFVKRYSEECLLNNFNNGYTEYTGKSNIKLITEKDDFMLEMNKLFCANPTLFRR